MRRILKATTGIAVDIVGSGRRKGGERGIGGSKEKGGWNGF